MRSKAIIVVALLIFSLAVISLPSLPHSFATAPTVVQSGVSPAGSGSDTSCGLSGTVAAGDTILVFASSAQNTEQNITAFDSDGNSYTNIGTEALANFYTTILQESVLISTNVVGAASDNITVSGLLNHNQTACVEFTGSWELSGSVHACSFAQTTGTQNMNCASGDVGVPVGVDCSFGHWGIASGASGTNVVPNTSGDCPEGSSQIRLDTNLVQSGGGADWTWIGTGGDVSVAVALVLSLQAAPTTQAGGNCCVVSYPTSYTTSSGNNFLTSATTTAIYPSTDFLGATSITTTRTTSTTTSTRSYPFIDNVVINLPPNTNVSETFNFIVDNSGAGNMTQMLSVSFSTLPSTSLSIPNGEIPLNVAANSRANLPANLHINLPGLKGGSYAIQGEATFLKFNGPTFAYVQRPFTVTINSGQSTLLLLESVSFWLLIIIVVVVVLVVTAFYLIRKR